MRIQRIKFRSLCRVLTIALLLGGSGCSRNENLQTEGDPGLPPSLTYRETSAEKRVQLSEEQAAELQIETHRAEPEPLIFRIQAPAEVSALSDQFAIATTPVNGIVARIHAHAGEEVRKGMPLLELESLAFTSLVASFLEAEAEQVYLRRQVDRLETLTGQNIASQSSLERARADLSRSVALAEAARARLRAIGVDEEQMQRWSEGEEEIPTGLTLHSPMDGWIQLHEVDLGEAVDSHDRLFEIVNPSRVLVLGFFDPAERGFLEVGARVVIRPAGKASLTGHELESTIASILPGLDPVNRSIVVHSIITPRNHWPVIGQRVQMEVEAVTPDPVFSLPLSALSYDGDQATIFVRQGERTFISRKVQVLRTLENEVIVSHEGVRSGEEVAVSQVFSLKALSRFEEYSEE